jgi:CheY-like chemotaxis protein
MSENRWILVAEDNPNDADLTLRALSVNQAPGEIMLVIDGAEALDCLYRRGAFQTRDDNPPAVILLDLKMPRVDGLEVLRQVKSDAVLKNIPVVIFTSSKERADLIRTYQMGANAYVVKPMGYREFVATLKDVKKFWLIVNEPPPADLLRNTDAARLQPDVQPSQPQLAPGAR